MGEVLSQVCAEDGDEASVDAADCDRRKSHKLRVGVWNAASGDRQYQRLAQPREAALWFKSEGHDVVICAESGRQARQAFESAGGYRAVAFGKGLAIFYNSEVLERAGWYTRGAARPVCLPGGGAPKYRDGTAGIQLFRDTVSDEKVLIVAVHAGHYGKLDNSWRRTKAAAARDALRDGVRRAVASWWSAEIVDKVVVGGDFNEIGVLIEADPLQWGPLPEEVRNVCGSTQARGTLAATGCTYDHIWVGGDSVDVGTVNSRKQWRFGSDHYSVSMWGV